MNDFVSDIMSMASSAWLIEPAEGETLAGLLKGMLTQPAAGMLHGHHEEERIFRLVGDVAVVRVSGPLGVWFGTGYADIQRQVQAADIDPQVKWILLDIASPGGLVSGCQETAEVIANASKRVVAYASGLCCSAAYWLAAACDEIVAADTGQLGCLGVAMTFFRFFEEFETTMVSSQTPHKRADLDIAEDRARIQVRLDGLADVFLRSVAKYRGFDTADAAAEAYGRGDTFVAADALSKGLCDRLHLGLPLKAPYPPSAAAFEPDGEEAMKNEEFEAKLKEAEAQRADAEAQAKAATQALAEAKAAEAEAKAKAAAAEAKAAEVASAAEKVLGDAQTAQDNADFELGVTQQRWTPAARGDFMAAAAEKRNGRPGWFNAQFGVGSAPPGASGVDTAAGRKTHGEKPASPAAGDDRLAAVIALANSEGITRAAASRKIALIERAAG
jgi:ClpP class serine protease